MNPALRARRASSVIFVLMLGLVPLPAEAQGPPLGARLDVAHFGAGETVAEVSPGDVAVTFTVRFTNIDNQTYTAVGADLSDNPHLKASYPGGDRITLGGNFKPGDVWNAAFVVDVNATIPAASTIQVPIYLHMVNTNAAATPWVGSYYPSAVVPGRSNLGIQASISVVPANAKVPVVFIVSNHGASRAGAGTLTVDTGASGFTVADAGNVFDVPALPPGGNASVTVNLMTPSTSGTASLNVRLVYVNAANAQASLNRTLGFRIAPPARGPLEVLAASSKLQAGQPGSLIFTIRNTASTGAADLYGSFKLPTATSPPFLTTDASDAFALGDLAAGEARDVELHVFTSKSAADLYSIVMTLSWTSSDGSSHTQDYNFGVLVLGTVNLQLMDVRGTVDATGRATVSGTVTNIGTTVARNAYLSVAGGQLVPATATYLGDVNTNSPLAFSVTTTLQGNGTGGGFGGRGANGTGTAGGGGAGGSPRGQGQDPAATTQPGAGSFPGAVGGGAGSFPGANRTGGTAGFGLGGGATLLRFSWNDDYGFIYNYTANATVPLRQAAPSNTGRAQIQSTDGGLLAPGTLIPIAILGAAVAGGSWWWRKKRQPPLDREDDDA